MEFHEGTLFHPRGGDLSLLIQIEEGAVVPNRIEFRSKETVSGIRNRGYFTRQGENRFLYNVKKDPGERRTLAAEYPEMFQRLRKETEAWMATATTR